LDSKQRPGAKNIFSILDKNFSGKEFLIASKYAFCSALMRLYMGYYSNIFAHTVTGKIRTQEKQFCHLTVHYGGGRGGGRRK